MSEIKGLTVGDMRKLLASPKLTDDMPLGFAELGDSSRVVAATSAWVHWGQLVFDCHPDAEEMEAVDDPANLESP